MLPILKRAWSLLTGPAASEPPGAPRKDLDVGRALLAEVARRLEVLAEVKGSLLGIPQEDRSCLVDELAARFAAFVVDLPASERNHHAVPFGLLDHSLEVARVAVATLTRPSFRASEDPAANYREQWVWAYGGYVLGLLHDVGKVLDIEVVLGEEGPTWDPRSQPLADFLRCHKRSATGPEAWRWKRGRGLTRHAAAALELMPMLLPRQALEFLGGREVELFKLLGDSQPALDLGVLGPARRVVGIVRAADQQHVAEGSHTERTYVRSPAIVSLKTAEQEGSSLLQRGDQSAGSSLDHRSSMGAKVQDDLVPQPLPQTSPNCEQFAEQGLEGNYLPGFEMIFKAPRGEPQAGDPSRVDLLPREGAVAGPFRKAPEVNHAIEWFQSPEKLLEALQSWLRSGRMSRNSPKAAVLIRPDFIWLRYPDALVDLVRGKNVAWTTAVAERILEGLLKLPQLASVNPRSALVCAKTGARASMGSHFVRFKSGEFLPESELAALGCWPFEITVLPAVPASERLRSLRKT